MLQTTLLRNYCFFDLDWKVLEFQSIRLKHYSLFLAKEFFLEHSILRVKLEAVSLIEQDWRIQNLTEVRPYLVLSPLDDLHFEQAVLLGLKLDGFERLIDGSSGLHIILSSCDLALLIIFVEHESRVDNILGSIGLSLNYRKVMLLKIDFFLKLSAYFCRCILILGNNEESARQLIKPVHDVEAFDIAFQDIWDVMLAVRPSLARVSVLLIQNNYVVIFIQNHGFESSVGMRTNLPGIFANFCSQLLVHAFNRIVFLQVLSMVVSLPAIQQYSTISNKLLGYVPVNIVFLSEKFIQSDPGLSLIYQLLHSKQGDSLVVHLKYQNKIMGATANCCTNSPLDTGTHNSNNLIQIPRLKNVSAPSKQGILEKTQECIHDENIEIENIQQHFKELEEIQWQEFSRKKFQFLQHFLRQQNWTLQSHQKDTQTYNSFTSERVPRCKQSKRGILKNSSSSLSKQRNKSDDQGKSSISKSQKSVRFETESMKSHAHAKPAGRRSHESPNQTERRKH